MKKFALTMSVLFSSILGFSQNEISRIELKENSLNEISLPYKGVDLMADCKNAFPKYNVSKQSSKQDGPDVESIEIAKDNIPLLSIVLSADNPNLIEQIIVKSASITDVYGLKIGDSYESIKKKRATEKLSNYTNLHYNSFLFAATSNISYLMNNSIPKNHLDKVHKEPLAAKNFKGASIVNIVWQQNYNAQSSSQKVLWYEGDKLQLADAILKNLSETERLALGYLATFHKNECIMQDEKTQQCRFLSALGLGTQCSEQHLKALRTAFANDASALKKLTDCNMLPNSMPNQTSLNEVFIEKNLDKITIKYSTKLQAEKSKIALRKAVFKVKNGDLTLLGDSSIAYFKSSLLQKVKNKDERVGTDSKTKITLVIDNQELASFVEFGDAMLFEDNMQINLNSELSEKIYSVEIIDNATIQIKKHLLIEGEDEDVWTQTYIKNDKNSWEFLNCSGDCKN